MQNFPLKKDLQKGKKTNVIGEILTGSKRKRT
jgi:hypothetical protein